MISGAIGALNSLFAEVESGHKNINSLLGTLGSISSGIDKYEIERRSSLTAPLDPDTAMRLIGEKRKLQRYHDNLRLLGNMNAEAGRTIDAYFQELENQKQAHAQNVKSILEKKKQRARLLKQTFQYSIVFVIGIALAFTIITLVVMLFGKGL
tara:strand:- start:1526 stop:1984 length:459 start_codon:yes stop_codon:yes gene_type:complete